MKFQYENETFSLDFAKTMKDYEARERCDCPSCRNFQMQIHDAFPNLTAFFKKFGIDIRKPDEIFFNILSDGTIDYSVYYTAFGKILEHDVYTINISDKHDISVILKNGEIPNDCETEEYIVFSVEGIHLLNMIENM